MADFEQLPHELQERIKKDILEYGEGTTNFFIHSAPFMRMINDLKASDTDISWLFTIIHLINFLGKSQDPTPIHFAISREVLGNNEITDDKAVDILTRELVISCQKFQEDIYNGFSGSEMNESMPLHQDDGFLLPSRDCFPEYICQKDEHNLMDLLFAEFIGSFGETGKTSSKEIKAESYKRYKKFKKSNFKDENRPQFWELWIGQKEERTSIFSPYLRTLAIVIWEDVAKKKWEKITVPHDIQKFPVSLFNVMLTTKETTLNKIQKRITEFEKKIPNTIDQQKKKQLEKQLKFAKDIHQKATLNFPEDFRFSVYEQYAIYGAFKLLHDNKFQPTEFYFKDILEALHFNQINKKEITEIRKAFSRLVKQKFPCYMIYPDKSDPNKYTFYDGDEPIFKIWEFGTLDLNIDLSDNSFVKKKLFISLSNLSLLNNLNNFYSIVNSNLLSELRNYKKVSEEDLYFLAFLFKGMRFHKTTTCSLHNLCAILKKNKWLHEGKIKDKGHKRQIKDKVLSLLKFAQNQHLVQRFSLDGDTISITYAIDVKELQSIN